MKTIALFLAPLLLGFLYPTNPSEFLSDPLATAPPKAAKLMTGADQVSAYLPYLKGKRIGMVVNQTSIIGNKPASIVW